MTLVADDGKPIGQSHRMLLTIVGHVEKSGEQWNAARTSVLNHWGHGPALAEGIPTTFTIANSSIRHVWALDPTGTRFEAIPVSLTGGSVTFTVGPACRTVWYEIGE
jgi:hypothetical protein